MYKNTQVLIVGGSINGLTLAILLAQNGLDVTIIEPKKITSRSLPSFDGRAYALALTTHKMFNALNIWDGLKMNSEPILDIKIDAPNDRVNKPNSLLHFNHLEMAEDESPMGYIVEDRYLRKYLFSQLKSFKNINIMDESYITECEVNNGHAFSFSSTGEKIKSNLIIGCDGKNSVTANFANINEFGWDYNQTSLVCAIDHEKPHNSCAYQLFKPSGPIAILPLPGNRSSIVWTEDNKTAAFITQLNKKDYIANLNSKINLDLGEISLSGKQFSYPLILTLREHFISDRIALVGDSAHGIHPLAGQGLNLGLRDVASIGEIIINAHRRGEDIGSLAVLKRYETWRRFETSMMAATTDIINKTFSNNNMILKTVTNLGLRFLNKNQFLKKHLIREAAGLNGNIPKLLQGKLI